MNALSAAREIRKLLGRFYEPGLVEAVRRGHHFDWAQDHMAARVNETARLLKQWIDAGGKDEVADALSVIEIMEG